MRVGRLAGAAVRVACGAAFVAPVVWMVAASLKPDAAIHAQVDSLRSFVPAPLEPANYVAAARRGDALTTLVNSTIQVLLIAACGLLINALAAYAFARMRFRGQNVLFMAVVATIIVPLEAIVIPLFMVVQTTQSWTAWLGWRPWTLAALSVPFMAKAFNIFLLRQSFLSLPRSLEEAAFLDGAGWWSAFSRVALPNVAPALVTVVLLDFVIHWNDFLWPLVISQPESTRTVQLGLANFFTQPPVSWGALMAYAVLATAPVTVAFTLGQRWITQSLATSGIRE